MFIGYQRSGHSFIGALLDAHPNVSMGMEVDALNLVRLGYSREQIYYCLIRNSEIFSKKLKNVWTGYSYAIPDQYQGTFTQLKVLGDKKGGKSTLRLEEDPVLFTDLQNLIGHKIKVLHVIRNPYDNIGTMVLRHSVNPDHPTREEIIDKMDLYFRKARINLELHHSGIMDIMDIYQESFISAPGEILGKILDFLELPSNEDYLSSCTAAVYDKPNQSRFKIPWPMDLKETIGSRMKEINFLEHYTFDN
jgi:hypothetical protein